MEKEEYLCGDVLVDVLNYFVKKEHINIFHDTTILFDVCETVRRGKRYSLNGYRLDFGALAQALLENSLTMYEITKNYVSDLSKIELDFTNVQDCNELSKQLYDQDEIEKFAQYLMTNDTFFHTLTEQFIDDQLIEPARKKEEAKMLKQVANKSDYVKELEQEKDRYATLRNAIIETNLRHGSKAAKKGFLHYLDTGNAESLSNTRYRKKLNSYSDIDVRTILYDYFIREYSQIEKDGMNIKQDFIDCLKDHSESIYQYKIPEEWYIEYVNDIMNGFYGGVEKENLCYQKLMSQVLMEYQKEKKEKNKR